MLDLTENIDKEINLAVNFIKDALSQEPSYIEVNSGEEEKEPLLLDKNLNNPGAEENILISHLGKAHLL